MSRPGDFVVRQLAELAQSPCAMPRMAPRPVSLGVAVPGPPDIPETGIVTFFMTNVPGDWSARRPSRDPPLAEATGLPTRLRSTTLRAFGLAELRFGAGRGVRRRSSG